MKVIKAFGPQDLRLVNAPDPVPGEGEVLIAVRASGICGSDKWFWYVTGPTDNVAGHEVAGEVVALGAGVHQLRVGDRVAVNNVVGCGTCLACRAGEFVRCPSRPGKDVNNGFGELVAAPARNCLVLDDRIDYEAGSLIFDNWGTPYGAVTRANVKCGDDIVVSGCGPIGLAAIALSKLRGAFVIAIDPVPYRLEAAKRMGADIVLTPSEGIIDIIHQLTSGAGASIVIECSGKGQAYHACLASLRIGGTLVTVGEHAQYELHPSDYLIRNHLNILGTWYTTMCQGQEVQDLMLQQKIKPFGFVTHRVSLEDVPGIFGKVCDLTDNVLKAIVLMPSSVSIK